MSGEIYVAEVVDHGVERPSCLAVILLVFLWSILSCAGIFASSIMLDGPARLADQHRPLMEFALKEAGVSAAITAAQVVSMCYFALVRWRSKPLLRHPGHWLVALVCLNLLLPMLAFAMTVGLHKELNGMKLIDPVKNAAVSIIFALGVLIAVCMNGLAGFRHQGIWRLGFFLSGACLCVPVISYFANGMYLISLFTVSAELQRLSPYVFARHLLIGISAIVFGYAALSDRFAGIRRDWVHWFGVVTTVAIGLIQLSYAVFVVIIYYA